MWDWSVQITFIAAICYDFHTTCQDICLILYALNLLCVFVVFTYQLKLYPKIAPFIVMITEGIMDVDFFVYTQMLFTFLFVIEMYIFGVPVEGDDGYSSLGLWGAFLQTFREGLGDFGNIHSSSLSGSILYGQSICWLILALVVWIIFANFMIA